MSIDPLTEDYQFQTPYAFSENRVIDGRELEGLERFPVNGAEFTRPVEKFFNSMGKAWESFKSGVANTYDKLDRALLQKKDNLQGSSQGHFKEGLNLVKKDKEDIQVKRGLETANSANEVKTEDADFFDVLAGGLKMSGELTSFEKLAEATDKTVSAIEKIKEKKAESKELKMIQVSIEPKKANQDYQSKYYVREDLLKKNEKK